LVRGTKSGKPGKSSSALSRCLGHREWRRHYKGWLLGCQGQRSDRSSRRHNFEGVSPFRCQPRVPIHVFGVEVAGHKNRESPQKHAVRSAPIIGREGERYAARIFTGLPANVTWMALASKWVIPRKGTEGWTIQRRTRRAVPPPAVSLSVPRQTVGKPEGLARVQKCLT
jgi:hypothetical protein